MTGHRLVLSAALVALAAISPATAVAAKPGACASGTIARAGSYVLALQIGPRQEMYMPSEVRERKLKTGQVMLGGEMAMIESAPAGTRIYDLQVHVCTKSGAVVTQLAPSIVVQGPGTVPPARVAVAIMAGIGKGLTDYHYGNDVALRPGSRITVTVTVKGKRAVFRAVVPVAR